MNQPAPNQIDPQRQIAAQQIGAVFNSLHDFANSFQHKDGAGNPLLTKQLEFAHQRIDEASMWAIKHVLTFGPPPAPPAAAAPPAPAEDNGPMEVAYPPTTDGGTPSESV